MGRRSEQMAKRSKYVSECKKIIATEIHRAYFTQPHMGQTGVENAWDYVVRRLIKTSKHKGLVHLANMEVGKVFIESVNKYKEDSNYGVIR